VHEHGHVPGFIPLLVMDVWEHAYMVDHGAGGRTAYITAFVDNVDWRVMARRFVDAIWLSPARQWC
jgi:Fe-Mn family superoxide dismutase